MAAATRDGADFPFFGIVCDLDGTLLDTEPAYFAAYKYACESLGFAEYTFDQHKLIIGHPEGAGAQLLIDVLKLRDDGSVLTTDRLLERRDEKLLTTMAEARPMPGAIELLSRIVALKIPLAIATSSSREYLPIKRKAAPEIFEAVLDECIVCGDDDAVLGKGKPKPDIFIEAAKRAGVDPAGCLAFEDAAAGVLAASSAGMEVIVCPDIRLDRSLFASADLVLDSLVGFDLAGYRSVKR